MTDPEQERPKPRKMLRDAVRVDLPREAYQDLTRHAASMELSLSAYCRMSVLKCPKADLAAAAREFQ